MITKMLFPGRYIQGFRAIERLENELPNFGKVGLCIMAPSAMKMLRDKMREQTAELRLFFEEFKRECCDKEIERVALGVLASLFLNDQPKALINEVYSFSESVGLPTTLANLGLTGVSPDELKKQPPVPVWRTKASTTKGEKSPQKWLSMHSLPRMGRDSEGKG
jgi:glycerol dehydrogenase-like iron-containing ADH family enzyme